MTNITKKCSIFFALFFFLFSIPFLNVGAQTSSDSGGSPAAPETGDGISDDPLSEFSQTRAFYGKSGYSGTNVDYIVGRGIAAALSILGVIFLVLVILSGYQWMTAGGNEDQVKKAQSRIKNAVIGLVIVVLAYAITAFIFKSLPGGSGQSSGGASGEEIVG